MVILNKIRLSFIFLLFFIFYVFVVLNLFFIQIKQSKFYENKARQQYHITITQTPARAEIYDRNGQPLALNKESFAAFIVPNNLKNPTKTLDFLQKNFPDAYKKLPDKQHKSFMYLKRRLTPQEKKTIENASIEDIQFLQEPSRFYPVPSLGHTIGVTNIDNKGVSGIELMYDQHLTGKPTTHILEKDARSNHFYFKKETTVKGSEGSPLFLTIDSELQFITYEEIKNHTKNLEAVEGCGIIMDNSGDILAMACFPDFNPNKKIPSDLFKTKNRIITEVYEPGSVMKVFPALAALEEELVTPEEVIDCENKKQTSINGIRVSTWKPFGKINFADVIRRSNNIGTSKVTLRMGTSVYDHLKKCGFGEKTNINFLGEQSGFITPPHKWSKATPISLSFGYEISASLLQIAQGFGIIANKGIKISPQLFINTSSQKTTPKKLYSEKAINQIREIIRLDYGGFISKMGNIPGYTIMGKTGTAYLITNGTYDTKRSIYTFAGIVEKDDYKRIIVVAIREPKPTGKPRYASTVAVPLFKHIAQSMLVHDKIL